MRVDGRGPGGGWGRSGRWGRVIAVGANKRRAEWEEESESDRALLRLVERGHAEGSIDPSLGPHWVQAVLWSLLYAAWMHARENDVPEYDALALCVRTLRKVVSP